MEKTMERKSTLNALDSIIKNPDNFIIVLIGLMLIERIVMFFIIGANTISQSDDVAYLAGGIYFAKTGIISVWDEMPTALIMPGMPFVTGLMSLLFGETTAYLVSLKIIWIILGCITPYFVYKSVAMFVPKWYGILAASSFLLPNIAWMDNVILTETPYLLFSTMCLYYTFIMGNDASIRYLYKYCTAFVLALLFRANILFMPIFTGVYLILSRKYKWTELLERTTILFVASLVLILPWTIRNYLRFDAFIPVSYGAYHPTLQGTYQGYGFPSDEELDYEQNVYAAVETKYPRYFNDDGTLRNEMHGQYIIHLGHKLKLEYRLAEWFKSDPVSLLVSYLIIKPVQMLNWSWYWGPYSDVVLNLLNITGKLNFVLCGISVILSIVLKKKREIVLFLTGMYFANLYIIAMSYAIERYAAIHMITRYMLACIGIYLIVEAIKYMKIAWKIRSS